MKLDLNFDCKKFSGLSAEPPIFAAKGLLDLFDYGQGSDETYMNKKAEWGELLNKTGAFECDKTDGEKIIAMVDQSRIGFDFVRFRIIEYIRKRIAESYPEKPKK